MDWLLLPRSTITLLQSDAALCQRIAEILDDDLQDVFPIGLVAGTERACATLPCGEEAALLSIWSDADREPLRLADEEILSLWLSRTESSLLGLDAADRGEVLHRVSQLAIRVWDKHPFPDQWHFSKHDGVDSVFAAQVNRAQNLRITFLSRSAGTHRIVDIGCPYLARKTPPKVDFVPEATILSLPLVVSAPTSFPKAPIEDVTEERDGEHDSIITKPTDSITSLFSLQYQEWIRPSGPLTRQQRRIIQRPLERPLRIHGPAGSGKTLVLILKALYLIREAQATNTRCHILFLVTSTAVQAAIRAAIEMIDDQASLATNRGDLQYLNLDTLHGWCIREMGAEIGGARILERDPKKSKELQHRILDEVYQRVYDREFLRLKEYLSKDFILRIEGKRDQLIRDLQAEIGIRIKGRGFRSTDRDLYVNSSLKSFIGRRESEWDRQFIFHVYDQYEKQFHEERLLDTDDIALSMAQRLSVSLWDRQRLDLGYDYVFVDETHLFNENERRVVPLLTRGNTDYPPIAMTFDEAQSIGGHRGELESVGILHSEKRILSVVHRCSPDIFALARDLVERSPLMFTEFTTSESLPRMPEKDIKRCRKPSIIRSSSAALAGKVIQVTQQMRADGFQRIGVIGFDDLSLRRILAALRAEMPSIVFEVEERGEVLAAVPRSGVYVMVPEACGGLEFDFVILFGVDQGTVPHPIGDLSREGYQSTLEEAYKELYTAITRARYGLTFVCDLARGPSDLLIPAISSGLVIQL